MLGTAASNGLANDVPMAWRVSRHVCVHGCMGGAEWHDRCLGELVSVIASRPSGIQAQQQTGIPLRRPWARPRRAASAGSLAVQHRWQTQVWCACTSNMAWTSLVAVAGRRRWSLVAGTGALVSPPPPQPPLLGPSARQTTRVVVACSRRGSASQGAFG